MANTYTRTTSAGVDTDTWTFDSAGNGTAAPWAGGPATLGISIASTMGGGTITWEWSPDSGTTWSKLSTISWTAATAGTAHLVVADGHIRPVLAAGAGWAITVFLK